MSSPSPYEWWDWDKLRVLAQLLRKETDEWLRREREKGVEWVERWKQHVGYDELDPRIQLFAVLAGTILDYGIVSECIPLYVQKLREAGLLGPEKISRAEEREVETALRKCSGCRTKKFGGKRPVPCRPRDSDEWFRRSAKWLIRLGEEFDEIVEEFRKLLEDIKIEEDGVVRYYLTPSHIYLILLRVPGIGPKKAAMVARDALVYDHEMTIPSILKKVFTLEGEIVLRGGYHTLVFMDVHALRVFERLGFIVVEDSEKLVEEIRNDRYKFIASQVNKIITPQYVAALAYPENPGAIDLTIWNLGRNVCKKRRPLCSDCFLRDVCYYRNARK